jgi:Uri superfamily endonuclease
MKGSYILLIKLEKDQEIKIGKLGNILFKKDFYIYIGSALNGLEQRINRHLIRDKKSHWHIDYLLQFGKIIDVYYKESNLKEECNVAKKLEEKLFLIPGFGCSDCRCRSHLFYGDMEEIKDSIGLSAFSLFEKYY